jgi:SAM-dependent methyltransferase
MPESSASFLAGEDVFETIPCPLCGSGEFEVKCASRYTSALTIEDLKQMFRASSDDLLLDQVVECRSCALVYVNPRLRAEIVVSGYAEAEDPLFTAQNAARIQAFRRTLRQVVGRVRLETKNKRLLDIGCAGGAFLVAAREFGFDVVGVEPSRWMAAFGREQYSLDIREGILQPGMFPPHSFDLVSLWDVIEHLPTPHETLALARALLKPDGLLIVNYPDIASLAARILGRRWPFWLNVHLMYYTPKTMTRQLQRAGFSPLWHQAFWPTLPLGYIARRAAPYSVVLAPLPGIVSGLGLGSILVPYNAGQTLIVSNIAASPRQDP